jgi:hypothetical protein
MSVQYILDPTEEEPRCAAYPLVLKSTGVGVESLEKSPGFLENVPISRQINRRRTHKAHRRGSCTTAGPLLKYNDPLLWVSQDILRCPN